MVLPASFYEYPMEPSVPDGYFPNRDLRRWRNQRFTIGSRSCRLINLKTYRFMSAQRDEPTMWDKHVLIDAMFSKHDQMNGANVHQVGRHVVNSVDYQPVFQKRRKDDRGMCWRFNSPLDVAYGTAFQIGYWLPDFLLRYVSGDYPSPDAFTESTLDDELAQIRELPEEELYSLFIDLEDEDSPEGE